MKELPMFPDEPNCRCWTTPVLLTPEEYQNRPDAAARDFNPSGRAAFDPLAYSDWFARADVASRKYAVGAKRYDAVVARLGNTRPVEWADFIDEEGKLLDLAKLRKLTPSAREELRGKVAQLLRDRTNLLQQTLTQGFVSDAPPPATKPEAKPITPRKPTPKRKRRAGV